MKLNLANLKNILYIKVYRFWLVYNMKRILFILWRQCWTQPVTNLQYWLQKPKWRFRIFTKFVWYNFTVTL